MFTRLSSVQVLGAVLLVSILGTMTISIVVFQSYEQEREALLQEELASFEDVAQLTLRGYDKMARFLFEEVINTPEVIHIFKDASNADPAVQTLARERLYTLLLPTYERMKAVKLEQLHFHLKDVTSFLRFHKPEKFGDSLKGIRHSLGIANRTGLYIEGFEEGRVYNGFRHVYPLSDAYGNHLGTVETSLAFHALRDEVEAVVGHYVDFVVKRTIVERKVWHSEQKNYYPSLMNENYLHEKGAVANSSRRLRSDHIDLDISAEATMMMKEHRRFALYHDGCVVTFIPVDNIQGEPAAAYLIGYKEHNVLDTVQQDAWIYWSFLMGMLTALAWSVYKLGMKHLQLNDMEAHDPLTRLLNQRTLIHRMEYEILRAERTEDPLGLIYIDVDDFKELNDRLGRRQCDALLVELAELFVDNTRRNDALARWSAESFMICLPHTTRNGAVLVANKLHQAIASQEFSTVWQLSCSIGVTELRDGDSVESLVGRVETNVLQAKAQGKNRILDT